MRFINTDENHVTTFGMLDFGDYFREGDDFYLKTDVENEDGGFYAINLETGETINISPNTTVIMIDIKEIIYREC